MIAGGADRVHAAQGELFQRLQEQGISLRLGYLGEITGNLSPGLKNGGKREAVYHDHLDLTLAVDGDQSGLWSGGTWFVHAIRNHGGMPSKDIVGDLQVFSNIEAPDHFSLHELWFEQRWRHDSLSLLVGLHDLNSEFRVSEYAGFFINSSFGVGPEMSVNVPVSLFPRAGWAVRARWQVTRQWYMQAGVYDGDPLTRSLHGHEGLMSIAEAGWLAEYLRVRVGAWHHSAERVWAGRRFSSDYGAYALLDYRLLTLAHDGELGMFVQWGQVPAARNEVSRFHAIGLLARGLLPGRHDDVFGVGIARAHTHLDAETAIELGYRMHLAPWLLVQPVFQWIAHPGGDARHAGARVWMFRFSCQL